ncbi:MAG TPA: leucyl aminopeptidase [Actinomycetes bacterium]|nr:leucyl aminopeptidase [Actinomycetes bacterium]
MPVPGLFLTDRPLTEPGTADVAAAALIPGENGSPAMPGRGAVELAAAHGIDLTSLLARVRKSDDGGAKPGEVITVPLPARADDDPGPVELLLAGVGDRSTTAYRRAGAAVAKRATGRRRVASAVAAGDEPAAVRAFAEGLALAAYSYSRKSGPAKPASQPVEAATLHVTPGAPAGLAELEATLAKAATVARAVHLARDLTNTPSNIKDPAWLAARAGEIADRPGLTLRVWDEDQLAADGFGGILAVGRGSVRPPRLIQLAYEPTAADGTESHVVLVGKGITFDSGGLSIKPNEGMVAMKADMAGGAAILAVLGALPDLAVPVRVTGLVATAENLPSGTAYRPDDVITQYGGTTVEVVNTDAEGRLVVADALAYADRNLDPTVLIDLATLTGAATLALSRKIGALYATDSADQIAAMLLRAGAEAGDRLWRMPLVEDYREAIHSEIADLCHLSTDRHLGGGSITAALFLREFTGGRPWLHLDIAGPGKVESEEYEITKGGTGFGVRALLHWLDSDRPLPEPA